MSAMTSFAAPLPGTKDVSRLTPNKESHYSTIDSPPTEKKIQEDDEDEKTKAGEEGEEEEGSTGSDVSDNEMEEDGDGHGKVALDFQSEGGSFKNPAGCRFERNWRSESEKMTGCSYV